MNKPEHAACSVGSLHAVAIALGVSTTAALATTGGAKHSDAVTCA